MGRIIKPKHQERVEEWTPRPHLVDLDDAPAHKTFEKASKVLADLPGGFQRFVAARADGAFVPVVMLWPTEFRPDIIDACQRNGAHVMVGQAVGIEAYPEGDPRRRK